MKKSDSSDTVHVWSSEKGRICSGCGKAIASARESSTAQAVTEANGEACSAPADSKASRTPAVPSACSTPAVSKISRATGAIASAQSCSKAPGATRTSTRYGEARATPDASDEAARSASPRGAEGTAQGQR